MVIFHSSLVKAETLWQSRRMMKTVIVMMLCATPWVMAQGGNNNNNNSNADAEKKQAELEERVKALESQGHNRFWQCNINGSELMVAVDRIGSISKTQYVLDGGLLCTEVTVDTLGGQSLARIYHVVPATDGMAGNAATKMVDRARELVDKNAARAGTKMHEMVQKSYPTTTHAHTVELRVMDVQDLDALYSSLKSTWITGKGRNFTIR